MKDIIIRSVIFAFCGALSLIFAFGLVGGGICGPGPPPAWGIVIYLLVSAIVPMMASSLLGRYWLWGGLSFSWAFAFVTCAGIADRPKDWTLLAPFLGCMASAILGSWAGHRLASVGRNET